MLKWHNKENISPVEVNTRETSCVFCSSLQQGSAPKAGTDETWAATAATAPCLGKFETRLLPEPRGARSAVTPASRSPMCEVTGVVANTRHQLHHTWIDMMDICLPCAPKHGMFFFFFLKMSLYRTDCTFQTRQDSFLRESWFKKKSLVGLMWAGAILMFLRAVILTESRAEGFKLNDYFYIFMCVNGSLWTRMWHVFVN